MGWCCWWCCCRRGGLRQVRRRCCGCCVWCRGRLSRVSCPAGFFSTCASAFPASHGVSAHAQVAVGVAGAFFPGVIWWVLAAVEALVQGAAIWHRWVPPVLYVGFGPPPFWLRAVVGGGSRGGLLRGRCRCSGRLFMRGCLRCCGLDTVCCVSDGPCLASVGLVSAVPDSGFCFLCLCPPPAMWAVQVPVRVSWTGRG